MVRVVSKEGQSIVGAICSTSEPPTFCEVVTFVHPTCVTTCELPLVQFLVLGLNHWLLSLPTWYGSRWEQDAFDSFFNCKHTINSKDVEENKFIESITLKILQPYKTKLVKRRSI
jgi:hypothetical protein